VAPVVPVGLGVPVVPGVPMVTVVLVDPAAPVVSPGSEALVAVAVPWRTLVRGL